MTDTLRYATDATVVSQSSSQVSAPAPVAGARSTVLPRVEWNGAQPNIVPFQRERFEELHPLGQGGMGEVVLLKDHDIERMVALKRLPPGADLDRLLRFVEEIRTVGQLDHPNIVPLHDVGIDERGRYYFVMKHLQGETLETIISRLRQGDREAHARFTFSSRVRLFLGVLNAMSYAHRKGFIHRDIKPANIMVGPFGEVTVMDWGLARSLRQPAEGGAAGQAPGAEAASLREAAALQTQYGSVVGTPMYMSPEQARGDHGALDERSDVYSLCVVLHELLSLRHYLEGRQSLADILEGVQSAQPNLFGYESNPHQPSMPAELTWFLKRGLAKEPAKRFQSVEEMLEELQQLMAGHIRVCCQRTLLKYVFHEAIRFVDSHPLTTIIGSTLVAVLMLSSLIHLLWGLLG